MPAKKQYVGTSDDFSKKLDRVMSRLGVTEYDYDYTSTRRNCTAWVTMNYHGRCYRFDNSAEKSAACGRNFTYASDLLGSVVYSLEGLARAVEQGIFTLDMLLTGVPALPAAPSLPECFLALGFTEMPKDEQELKAQYRKMAKTAHPDLGGSSEAFQALTENYEKCIRELSSQNASVK